MSGNKSGEHGPLIPLDRRAAILALHWHAGKSWQEISTCLGVYPETARRVVARAKARAGENAEFEDVYRCLEGPYEHENGASKRKRFAADSPEGKTLLDLSMSDLDHRDMPWTDIAKEAGIKAARSTIEKLFHENNVFRYVARLKPLLTQRMKDNRVKLAELGLTIDIRRIVFTDEMWIEFNSSRRKTHQTRFKGENPFEVAKTKNNDSATIRLMFWSAINSLLGPAPGYIYPKVNADDKKHQQEVQQAVNKIRQEEVVKKVKLSYQAGTRESEEVEAANRMVDELNLAEGRVGRSRRHYRTPEQVFRVKEIKAQTKGGINWVAYREQVLQPILYPWITGYLQPLLLSETGDSTVWLVEDNAPAHQAAQTIDFEDRLKMNIKTFNWPAHSPDLNKIEQAWDYEKDTIAMYQFTGASQATVESAKNTLLRTWEEYPKDLIERQCLDFHEKCKLVIENGGRNNFYG